jgi:putative ABC transport system permease protein
LHADLFVRPTLLNSSVMEARIDRDAAARIRSDPDVEATGYFVSRQVPLGDRMIRVAAADLGMIHDRGVILFKSPADAARAAIDSESVWVSESFSLRFARQPGDRVSVPTPQGMREFRVAAVYYDYASNQGTILMNGPAYARCFAEDDPAAAPSSLSIMLRPGADPEKVRTRLAHDVGDRQDLYFATNDNVRQEAMRIFDSTFRITYALELIAVVIAGLGVVSTLITLIYERQREIALLSLVGATRGQVRTMVVVEALLISGVSQALGVLIGLGLAMVLIYVVNVQSFAWTIQFHWPVAFLVQSTLLVLATAAVCGLYPATRAANIHAIRVAREE